jgi:ATP-dependent Lhr-like helicase
LAQQLLTRHGVVTRETVAAEGVAGGFSAVYDVLKAMEESGRIRRGYFVGGLGGAQFALPPAVDMLRSFRDVPEEPAHVILAATDPANPYGAVVKWAAEGPTRSAGARVIVVDGLGAGYLRRGERELLLFAPEAEPQRSRVVREVARALLELATARELGRQGMLIVDINGQPAATHPLAHLFVEQGFATTAMGLQARVTPGRLHGIGIAGSRVGGESMADSPRTTPKREGDARTSEHESVRSSNDRDEAAEREGIETEHNRGDVDPDSAASDVDRDDTVAD